MVRRLLAISLLPLQDREALWLRRFHRCLGLRIHEGRFTNAQGIDAKWIELYRQRIQGQVQHQDRRGLPQARVMDLFKFRF